MKAIAIILLLLPNLLISQNGEITFSNDKSAFQDIFASEFETKVNDIIMKQDSTFEFWSRPMRSCRTWSSYEGNWSKMNDTIIFKDQYEVYESEIKFSYPNNENQDFYEFQIKTDRNSILQNREITISYQYDFDSDLEDETRTFKIDKKNKVKISFSEIPNHQELASFEVDYYLSEKERRRDYVTLNNTINRKSGDLPKQIIVEIIEAPIVEIVYRTSKAIIEKDTLKIISCKKTKTEIPDYYSELEFEDEYKIEK